LKRKASLSKEISKRRTAKIFVSYFLELSLRKIPVQIFEYLFSKFCVIFSKVCRSTAIKSCFFGTAVSFGSREVSLESIFKALGRIIVFYVFRD